MQGSRKTWHIVAIIGGFGVLCLGAIGLFMNSHHKSHSLKARSTNTLHPKRPHLLPGIEQYDEDDLRQARLPPNLVPYHQNIELQPNIYNDDPLDFNFAGSTEVFFNVNVSTKTIEIHNNGLEVVNSSIRVSDVETGAVIAWTTYEIDEEFYLWKLNLSQELTQGRRYSLRVDFNKELTQSFSGLYWDSYESPNGTRYLVATQFQTTSARRAFPCFDEPAMKATFNVTLLRKSHMSSISNMPIGRSENRPDNWVADIYETTPVMSSYLLAFVVSDYTKIQMTSSRGVVHRIWMREAAKEYGRFALNSSAPIVEWLEDYTGVSYPLPKLDHIALPNKGGAMENWGLVTYGESGLLFDEKLDNAANRYGIGGLMGHEVAHMWFGNIVTCKWWTHTWLNEGFATLFSQPALRYIDSTYPIDEIGALRLQSIMLSDSASSNVPTVVNVEHPSEIGVAFGPMTYSKGATIGRMLQYVMTEESYRKGLNKYLNRHLYGNAVTDDLWAAMTEQAAADGIKDTDGSVLDIKTKMDPWVLQIGYPKVTVRNNGDGTANLWQNIYLADPSGGVTDPSPFDYEWYVPVSYATSQDKNFTYVTRTWMNRNNITITGLPTGSNSWLWVNNLQSGYYRTLYDDNTRNALLDQLVLDPTIVPGNNKAQFIDDAYQYVIDRSFREIYAMNATKFLSKETDPHVWYAAESYLSAIDPIFRFRASFANFQRYVRKQSDPIYGGINWDNNDVTYLGLLTRSVMFPIACSFGNADCLDKAHAKLQTWRATPNDNPIRPDLRDTVYCYSLGSANANSDDWNFLFTQYQASDTTDPEGQEGLRLVSGLICSQDSPTLSGFLDWSLVSAPREHMSTIWWGTARTRVGRPLVWNYLRAEWADSPLGGLKYSSLMEVVNSMSAQQELDEVNAFIASNPPIDEFENETFVNARNTVQNNMNWVSENENELVQFFDKEAPASRYEVDGPMLLPWKSSAALTTQFNRRTNSFISMIRNEELSKWTNMAARECELNPVQCAFIHPEEYLVQL